VSDNPTVLVVGASGVIGRDYIRHIEENPDWNAIGVSRRPPADTNRVRYISADLSDADAATEALSALPEITHMMYAGYTDRPTWAEQCEPNAALLRNALDAVERGSGALEHVVLMQGQKYYGSHLGPFKTPTREDDPRHMPPNFYYNQQDLLAERSANADWHYSCLRPHVVCGYAARSPMNIVLLLGVFASVCKALNLPLFFPGKPRAYRSVYQATDARLLSSAIHWAATNPMCDNESYNITNGDFFRWEHLWPKMAEWFDMPLGPVQTLSLAQFMTDKDELWSRIVSEHGLNDINFSEAVKWGFGDYVFSCEWDIMASTTKSRQHGFLEFIDSEERFLELFQELRDRRVIP